MQLRFSREEKDLLHKIHLLSGRSYEEVKDVFEGFLYLSVLSYLEKDPVLIPFFGEFDIRYIRDAVTKEGREAELDITFEPNQFLKRVIGQIEDKDESDLEKMLKTKIHTILEDLLK